ncbi:hypothetical protein [Ktedonobacter robiniae]|uniref:hypothetical protein n=1 Tax=Ktedonobacter robiniae TaxID=2778365 RepID=UPI001F41A8A9|nr:hypothetical protein [Ktedonobacter robiniae]
MHRAHLTHENIALKRLRGLLGREERTLLLQCSQEQRLPAARLPTLLLLEHLTTWFTHHWEHATDGKHRLIAHLQAHKAQYYDAPIKQHGQAGEAREETQPPHKKHSAAPLRPPREETWACDVTFDDPFCLVFGISALAPYVRQATTFCQMQVQTRIQVPLFHEDMGYPSSLAPEGRLYPFANLVNSEFARKVAIENCSRFLNEIASF